MSVRARAVLAIGVAASSLAAPALADPPAPAAPAKPAKREPPPPLPDPEVRLRLITPSAEGPWTFRIDNEGTRFLRVPADIRLLRLTVEDGNTLSKRAARPVQCAVPQALRPDGFPDKQALLLGPGDSYVETFDPRLFCFGKDAQALAGGAIVHARFGWDPPAKGAKKVDAPFAVEGTTFPAEVAPLKQLLAPTVALSYFSSEDEEQDAAPPPAPAPAADAKPDDEAAEAKPAEGQAAPAVVDENAARMELKATPWVDAASGNRVAMTVTVTNAGHRAALVAVRSRMLSFHVHGPDGVERCGASPPTRSIPREGFQTLKPGASVTQTVLVEEACGMELFRRPGLYRVIPSVHLDESGSEIGLAAYTGTARAKEPTLVRVSTGPEPFYRSSPKAVRTETLDPSSGD